MSTPINAWLRLAKKIGYLLWLGLIDLLQGALKVTLGIIFAVLLLAWAQQANAQIPTDAAKYKHQLRQQAHLIWGLDAPTSTFAAQIHQESHWKATARSHVGAEGLSQFMPSTAVWISGVYPDLADNAPTNPTWAIRALIRYDKFLIDRIAAENKCEHMAFALSAYNGGLGWVNKRKAKSSQPQRCLNATCEINPGITAANQRENADYPRRILLKHEPLYVNAGWGAGSCA